jgi:hypothetical protein
VGVSEDIIEASWEALVDSIIYAMKKHKNILMATASKKKD